MLIMPVIDLKSFCVCCAGGATEALPMMCDAAL
jgi:hypothetical protein